MLVALDTVDTGEKMWIPIDSFDQGQDNAQNLLVLQERYDLMLQLYPEVFEGVEVQFVEARKSVDSYKAVIYVKATSDEATRMKNLISAFNNA